MTRQEECDCPLCDSHATEKFDGPTSTLHFHCEKCGEYRISDILLAMMLTEHHWEQMRKRLGLALQRGVVRNRVFNHEQDIMNAMGELNRATDRTVSGVFEDPESGPRLRAAGFADNHFLEYIAAVSHGTDRNEAFAALVAAKNLNEADTGLLRKIVEEFPV